ncbi:MAG: Rieske (2Fe-2S) protein [Solirubrobacteraceae bacterium]
MRQTQAVGTEVLAGARSDFVGGTRRLISFGSIEIGVICHEGRFFAYENRCVHQGGPVCEGRIIGRVEAVLGGDKTLLGERFSETEIHLVCPWHGYEYDLETGECAADRHRRLRRYEVIVREEQVYVVV